MQRADDDAEARLSAHFARYSDEAGHGYAAYLAKHPRAAVQVLRDLGDIPLLDVWTADGLEGRLIGEGLPATARGPRSLAAALALPGDPAAFSEGSSMQTLRRKTRAAERAGVTWGPVDDPQERRMLLDLANDFERTHPLARYRKAPPDNPELLDVRLWLLARAADGRPLMLSITPVDGPSALLGLFRVFEQTDEASAARYLMTKVLAEQLIARGVTHLFDAVHPARLSNGLRHFQRMVGFRLVRVARRPGPRAGAAPRPTALLTR
jgi:hypothetical protein